MTDKEKVIKGLECHAEVNCVECPYRDGWRTCPFGETLLADAIALLKEHESVVRCEDCENWIPGYITDHDDFIPPKCGKYQQMVGHSADDYCSLAERKESQ